MATLVKIGNSQGVRIPKALIEQAQLEGRELEFKILDKGLLIQPVRQPRQGWKQVFDKALENEEAAAVDRQWLEASLSDDENWEW
ncbi:MAG: AbrB/MazE/SpoVT family DNA-binding domain-containing protein [Candidatus Latescibacteria bacterium]|nr:AbrB/MazE/SpoVT family DNA-binding domain-containing protein [Candidatus Latescibacterota bacterium]